MKESLKIKIKYFDPEMPRIEKINIGDWIDLRSAKAIEFKAGDFIKIPLGVAMQLPKGYEGNVLPRSGTFKNYHMMMVNSMAVIDESFCGDNDEWIFQCYATADGKIEKFDRVCQFRITEKMPPVEFEEAKILGNKDRGGLGHTGVK